MKEYKISYQMIIPVPSFFGTKILKINEIEIIMAETYYLAQKKFLKKIEKELKDNDNGVLPVIKDIELLN